MIETRTIHIRQWSENTFSMRIRITRTKTPQSP